MLFRELQFALRTTLKNRRFAAAAAVCLALGIGANSTMFSLIDGYWTRPLPIRASLHDMEVSAMAVGLLAVLGLILASIGLYGVMSYYVVRRTREIGIRMALGAQRTDMLRLVLSDGLRLVLIGAVIGAAGAFIAGRFVAKMLYGVSPTDPLAFCGVIGVLIIVTLVASFLPARRAIDVDPSIALRYD